MTFKSKEAEENKKRITKKKKAKRQKAKALYYAKKLKAAVQARLLPEIPMF